MESYSFRTHLLVLSLAYFFGVLLVDRINQSATLLANSVPVADLPQVILCFQF
jgi:hypothetical protein